MSSRHISRSVVLQTLFESDMQHALSSEKAGDVLKRNFEEFSGSATDRDFAETLLAGVLGKHQELDAVIEKAAPQWPLAKIAPIDRNVLRIGLYELLYGDHTAVPPKVALNEAIELAKSYGGDSSGKFINGVLGAVYRDMGSPGKSDSVKTPAPLPHEGLGGIVVVVKEGDEVEVALVYDIFGRWTLPKARSEEQEMSEGAAKRAALLELGVTATNLIPLGEHEYIAHEPSVGRIVRTVGYFLAVMTKKTKLKSKEEGGIMEARWFPESEIKNIPTYNDLLPILEAGIAHAKKV